MTDEFKKELQRLINKHSIDAEVEMHDFVLADYICRSLKILKMALANEERLR